MLQFQHHLFCTLFFHKWRHVPSIMTSSFIPSLPFLNRLEKQQNRNVSWWLRGQIKLLAWPMAELQIAHRKSNLVLSARFPVVKWTPRQNVYACVRLSISGLFFSHTFQSDQSLPRALSFILCAACGSVVLTCSALCCSCFWLFCSYWNCFYG